MSLKGLVIGSGWAAEGHTLALRHSGVEVVAVASRSPERVEGFARRLEIPTFGVDWRDVLAQTQPDLVAIGTPGTTHEEMGQVAAESGCHVLIDKPLTCDAPQARRLWQTVRDAKVKSAYAATMCYEPAFGHVARLIADGCIGTVYEVQGHMSSFAPIRQPFTWYHSLEQGGGILNGGLPHLLACVLRGLSGISSEATVLKARGEARFDRKRAPASPPLGDARKWRPHQVDGKSDAELEWKEVDVDSSFNLIACVGTPDSDPSAGITTVLQMSTNATRRVSAQIEFFGSEGTLHVTGFNSGSNEVWLWNPTGGWQQQPVPPEFGELLTELDPRVQRNWNELVRRWIADIEGRPTESYLTVRDGWLFQELIDATRISAPFDYPSEP